MKRIVEIGIVLAAVVLFAAILVTSALTTPYALGGHTYDEEGTPLVGTNITFTNQRTGEIIYWTSTAAGEYSADAANFPSAFENGDIIHYYSVYGALTNTTTAPIDTSGGGTLLDIYLYGSTFDTGYGTYPSIWGIHNGTITPNREIKISKLYTYPCKGTGGHSEYIRIWNASWEGIEAHWDSYRSDWHNISFDNYFILYLGVEYNYTIHTGSYPLIIHEKKINAMGGEITCTKFVDANGEVYKNGIPCIKLLGCE